MASCERVVMGLDSRAVSARLKLSILLLFLASTVCIHGRIYFEQNLIIVRQELKYS